MKKKIPIGVVNFEELQLSDYYVVDKTLMIQEFVQRGSKVTLITRPRRFGKTSNMSMMSAFFDISKDSNILFKDTNIAKTDCITEMNQYPVIFLSFANCKGEYSAMKKLLFETLRNEYGKYRDEFDQDNLNKDLLEKVRDNYKALCEAKDLVSVNTSIKILSEFLYELYHERVMIFIDEYDTPFIEAHVNGYYNEIRGVLASLLHSALKDNKNLQYAMLTGIQRAAKENIFSDLNNLDVFTVKDKGYAQYFGFTTEETKDILEYYGQTLDNDATQMYDGYNMGGIDIFNPWSIINYVNQKELIPYWVNTSSNTMIKQAIHEANEDFKEDYEFLMQHNYVETIVNLETSFYEIQASENLWGLFVNAGYLTIDKVIDLSNKIYRLRIPNDEVLNEFKSLIAYHLNVQARELILLYQSLKEGNPTKFIKAYRRVLLVNPSYYDLQDENSYHMLLLGTCLFIKNDFEITSNQENGKGRSDLQFKAKRDELPSYVIEIKHTKNISETKELAKQAVEQIIRLHYDAQLSGEIIYIGLAHCGKEVFMNWQSNKENCIL